MRSTTVSFVSLVAMAMISGCVVVPHPVPADVVEIADSDLDPDLVVSAGPRRLIEKIGRRLADEWTRSVT